MKRPKPSRRDSPTPDEPIAGLRIIGGTLRGRKLQYSGDVRTRPMKDRVRESVFNLLGPDIVGTHAIDLFAGTGALGLEAVSRGAARATLIERHLPTTRLIEQNVAALGVGGQVEVVFFDAFVWTERFQPAGNTPVTVFVSPPYDFYEARREDMSNLVARWVAVAPADSLLVIEADERFDFSTLPQADEWNVRQYPPAVIGIFQKA